MTPFGQAKKLRRSRSFTEGTGREVTLANLRPGMKSDPTVGLDVSRAPLHSSCTGTYTSQPGSGGIAYRYCDEDARNVRSMPEMTTPDIMPVNPAHGVAPPRLTVESPGSTVDSASPSHVFPYFPTDTLSEKSPFRDPRLLERLRLASFGENSTDGYATVNFASRIEHYFDMDYQACENFVTHADALCRFFESHQGIGETRITDVLQVLRGASGWPYAWPYDEVTQAWKILYFLISFPPDTTPIKMSCATIEEQIRTIFPLTPPHATPFKFESTLSDILRAGLKVKPAVYFLEHLQVEKDGNDLTVRLMRTSPYDVGFYKSFLHSRAARALHMDRWIKEIIGSTFALYGNRPYDMTAKDLNLFDQGTLEEFYMMRTLFRKFGNTPPKFLAHRTIELENLVRSRRAFWPTLRRDLRRQRKEQPFTFWGAILALFFGICTVIQTVASVWALVTTVQPNNAQGSQTIPGNVVNGMRILGSPWLTCMSNEQFMAATKENATISCLLQVGFSDHPTPDVTAT
ncbi:hypothetical protein BD410DRAFT_783812 [Rickenella mellea]|uniref:Transmembrane protein n=1 Tax=Rickenella mellea TaxID=50990 RepID=A0A4Y7QHJ9_9AGAM|nr:hypothetical protein BD410DRAFT_783812 [Rickenella mellea]